MYLLFVSVKMSRARITDADRSRLIECYENGEDFLTLAGILGVKRQTAYSIIRRYQENGRRERGPHGGSRAPVLDGESVDFLLMLIEDNPCITIREMNRTLQEGFPNKPFVSDSTVSRSLDNNLITVKQAHNIPGEQNLARVKEDRVDYAYWMYKTGMKTTSSVCGRNWVQYVHKMCIW